MDTLAEFNILSYFSFKVLMNLDVSIQGLYLTFKQWPVVADNKVAFWNTLLPFPRE
jgi:hypothetical protein